MKYYLVVLLGTFCLESAFCQNWSLGLNEGSSSTRLGTSNSYPVKIFTKATERVVIDTNGTFRIASLSGTGFSFLGVDENGSIQRGINGAGPISCGAGLVPWTWGGNNVTGASGANVVGTCNNYDFVLQSYSKKGLFITAANTFVGIGENNSSPASVLDICDPSSSNTDHTRIYGDKWGSIESTNELNFYYNSSYNIHKGNYGGTWATVFHIDNAGNTGIGTGVNSLSSKFTVSASSSDAILSKVSSDSDKLISGYNANSSKSNFNVFGNGKCVFGNLSVGSNPAFFNLNLSSGQAINVFNSTSSSSPFTVMSDGNTTMGEHNEIGLPSITEFVKNSNIALGVFQDASGGIANCVQLKSNTSGDINTLLIVDRDDDFALQVRNGSTGVPKFRVLGDGKTYIGSKKADGNHNDAMLSVDGKLLATSIFVNSSSTVWSDFVFNEDYNLLPLNAVESYYQKNKHLPGVPNAKEIELNGDNLFEMDATLLKKIEELTLYIVELKKEVDVLKKASDKK